MKAASAILFAAVVAASSEAQCTSTVGRGVFETSFSRIRVDAKGFLTSIQARSTGKEYVAKTQPSPLLALSAHGKTILPTTARCDAKTHTETLAYPNGSKAKIRITQKGAYLRLQLLALDRRGDVDNVVWGPIHTTISKTIGDMIGVVRDDDWAIGLLALNDNTTQGPPVEGDLGQMYYYIHSPDPKIFPVPPQYREGQRFSIGGDGYSDVAFYSHPEEYFDMGWESGAVLEPGSGSAISYHSRDRRKPQSIFFTVLPGLKASHARHQIVDPVDADFIGSSVALYACPDKQGRDVIEDIVTRESLNHLMVDGKWAKDPAAFRPDIAWYGPHDRLAEYAYALGLKSVQDEGMGEYYVSPADPWDGKRVGFANGHKIPIREFSDELRRHGIRFGLHTLCTFIQPGSGDVQPVPNPHLQTVLRTHLASPLAADQTDIIVTDPSFLAEKGTWHDNDTNVLRIGTELLTYNGISSAAPWTLQNIKRAQYGTHASAHAAGDELVKLQMNCYHGFAPDMRLLLGYADLYAKRLSDLGMDYIDFDGLESCMYQNHGDFAFKSFFRRLFDTFHRLTGGRYLRVMGSCVTEGNWHYMSVCNVGGGTNMFDPVHNRWGIEGKDVRYQFESSYFPATFGIQDYQPDWCMYDAENLEAKSVGWNAMYMLGLSQNAVEKSGDKPAIFRALRTWQTARAIGVFTDSVKKELQNMDLKFHLTQTGSQSFALSPVKESTTVIPADALPHRIEITNPYQAQSLQFALHLEAPKGAAVETLTITLPNGRTLTTLRPLTPGEYIISTGKEINVADATRRKLADPLLLRADGRAAGQLFARHRANSVTATCHPERSEGPRPPAKQASDTLPTGQSTLTIQSSATPGAKLTLTVWTLGKPERISSK